MSLQIEERCVNCWACQPVCPSEAIFETKTHFRIDEKKCTECQGDYAEPQCSSICPIEAAIVDRRGNPIHPIGSLTGISPERWAAVEEQVAAYTPDQQG